MSFSVMHFPSVSFKGTGDLPCCTSCHCSFVLWHSSYTFSSSQNLFITCSTTTLNSSDLSIDVIHVLSLLLDSFRHGLDHYSTFSVHHLCISLHTVVSAHHSLIPCLSTCIFVSLPGGVLFRSTWLC